MCKALWGRVSRTNERLVGLVAWRFLSAHSGNDEKSLRFELDRYLGWPGQAPSYKVGERIWLQARDEAKQRKGSDFDLKSFHRDALNLGSLGLDRRGTVDALGVAGSLSAGIIEYLAEGSTPIRKDLTGSALRFALEPTELVVIGFEVGSQYPASPSV